MAYLKTEAPVFRGDESVETRVERLGSFAAQLRRELEYVLTHIGGGNMNGTGLSIAVTDEAGNSVGSIGKNGGGVGLVTEGAGVTVSDGIVTLWAGSAALRIAAGSVETTADGKTWRSLLQTEER